MYGAKKYARLVSIEDVGLSLTHAKAGLAAFAVQKCRLRVDPGK